MLLPTTLSIFALLLSSSAVQCKMSPRSGNGYDSKIDTELRPKLSSGASIVHHSSAAPRWSEYHAPKPGTIVNVAEEVDVQETVKYCIEHNLDFLAQGGAHGWATTIDIKNKDVVINLRGLNQAKISDGGDSITFGGGAIVSDLVNAANEKGVQVVSGGCNCVGIGALLGGGLGRLMGLHGAAVDNLLSMNLVTSTGDLITATPTSPSKDLWFGLRGAGANLGIVTSVTMKAYPPPDPANNSAWLGNLVYPPSKLEAVVQAIADLEIQPEMAVHFYFAALPPAFEPTLLVVPWYAVPDPSAAKLAFQTLLDLEPIVDTTRVVPFNEIANDADFFCGTGSRKTGYHAGLKTLDPTTYRKVWDEWIDFVAKNPEAGATAMLTEIYFMKKTRELAESSEAAAFTHRDINYYAFMLAWYNSTTLDPAAEEFGNKVRKLLHQSSGFDELKTYINFAHGDESLQAIYGSEANLVRLRKVKTEWDPKGRFDQFFPIPRNQARGKRELR